MWSCTASAGPGCLVDGCGWVRIPNRNVPRDALTAAAINTRS